MKLKNAPERKRLRQLGALGRFQNSQKLGCYIDRFGKYRKVKATHAEKQIKVLEKRTMSSRRDIRTKKTRGV